MTGDLDAVFATQPVLTYMDCVRLSPFLIRVKVHSAAKVAAELCIICILWQSRPNKKKVPG